MGRIAMRPFVITHKVAIMNIEIIPVTSFQQNCSLIWDDEKNAAIIDPGGEAPRLIARIEELGLHLRTILLTDRKSTRLNSSHSGQSRMPSSA